MKTLIVAIFLISLNASAQSIALPPSVSSIDDMINGFRNTLTTKIGELGKNFISQLSDKTIVFTNSTLLNCNGTSINQGEPVSTLQYNFKKANNELVEKSIYTGCGNQISLVEDVITKGGKLTPLKYSDFIKGKREFDLKDDETYRLYRLSNSDNEEIFKILIEKNNQSKLVEFYILGQKFLRMNFDFQEKSTRLTYTYSGYTAKYVRKYASWEMNVDYQPFTNTVLATSAQVIYLNTEGNPLSQSEYLFRFDRYATSGPLTRIRKIMEYHNFYFPTTKVVQTGSGNEHLKEELRIAFNRLQNNVELNLVKKQLQEYMEAAENGLIIDNRPKQ